MGKHRPIFWLVALIRRRLLKDFGNPVMLFGNEEHGASITKRLAPMIKRMSGPIPEFQVPGRNFSLPWWILISEREMNCALMSHSGHISYSMA